MGWWLLAVGGHSQFFTELLPGLLLYGLGLGMVGITSAAAALVGLEADELAMANSAFQTTRRLAQTLGTASAVAILGNRSADSLSSFRWVWVLNGVGFLFSGVVALWYPARRRGSRSRVPVRRAVPGRRRWPPRQRPRLPTARRQAQAVADAAHGVDQGRVLVVDLVAQVADVGLEDAGVAGERVVPHRFEDLLAGRAPAGRWTAGSGAAGTRWRELDQPAGAPHVAGVLVEHEVVVGELAARPARRPSSGAARP